MPTESSFAMSVFGRFILPTRRCAWLRKARLSCTRSRKSNASSTRGRGLLEEVLDPRLRLVDDRFAFRLHRLGADANDERQRHLPRFLVLGGIVVVVLRIRPATAGSDEPGFAVVALAFHP